MREEKLMQSIRNATLEEVRKIATMVIKTSMGSDQKIEAISDKITALIERNSEQKYTRKQVQEACANAYQRGVDNRPYIEKFDEWVKDEEFEQDGAPMAVDLNTKTYGDCFGMQYDCPNCDYGFVYDYDNFCSKCGQKITFNPPKSEEV